MRPQPQNSSATAKSPADDYALMAGVRNRDSLALAALYDRYSAIIYGTCLRALADPRDAEDLLIDIFSEIWERGDRYDPTRGSPIGHMMGLTRSRVIDRLRSRRSASAAGLAGALKVDAALDVKVAEPGPLDSAIDAELCRKVSQALHTLAPEQREALELAYFEALSHSEIAERLGQPLGTIKSRIRQSLIRLRECLGCGD